MPLKTPQLTKFSTIGSLNANFDYFDLLTNIAFKKFYASVNNTNSLSPHLQDSNTLRTERTTDGTTEINFDYEFNLNMTVSGDFTISYTIDAASGSTTGTTRANFRIIKVDTSDVETEIVGTITGDSLASVDGNPRSQRMVISGNIPSTIFAVGEKIRVEVSLVVDVGSGGAYGGIYHDPTSRDTPPNDAVTGIAPATDLTFVIPFEVSE